MRCDRPVELVLLPFEPGGDNTALQFGFQVPATAVGDDPRLPVWIRPHALEPDADVILGDSEVGSTTFAPAAWTALLDEAERGVYSDGALSWRSRPQHTAATRTNFAATFHGTWRPDQRTNARLR